MKNNDAIVYLILIILMVILLITYSVYVIIDEKKKMKYYYSNLLYETEWDKFSTMAKKNCKKKENPIICLTLLVKIKEIFK